MGSQRGGSSPLDTEIIAIVKDAKYAEVKGNVPALFFVPYLQDNTVGSLTFYVRTSFEPEPLTAAVRGVVARLDANLPVDNLRTMERQVQENISIDRLLTILSASFAVLATLLAAVASTACWRIPWRSVRARSACAWPSAPRLPTCAG